MPKLDSLPAKFDFPAAERDARRFWEESEIFQKSLEQRRSENAEHFVFYEGPPTANGLPHPGHCLTRVMKDLFPRYQTMCGKLVERKAGWDTHGLPVEVEVCKELGIHTKEEIEAYGVERFVKLCIESVFRYTREWEELTNRLGFWVNLDEAYVTFHQSYVESVWWGLKTLYERDLLYQGHKVVWWWAQGGTALSQGEVGEGYRDVDDPSIYVRFPLVDGPDAFEGRTSLLVWTTTPWTLVSNHFAAVHPEIEYALCDEGDDGEERLWVAKDLVEALAKKTKRKLTVVRTCKGADLLGLRYEPPFPGVYYGEMGERTAKLKRVPEEASGLAGGGATELPIGWRVLAADFVTIDAGSGLVHEAPAFGEVDFDLLQQERARFEAFDAIPLLCAVKPDGSFSDDAPPAYRGRWVKEADKDITRELKDRGLLVHHEVYHHPYPFCPRAEDDALIQYARKSWFVRTSAFKDEFLRNNAGIKWLPEHIRDGRFGDFLRNNVDWALSRERFWGTPLPIWRCEATGKMEAAGCYDELLAKPDVAGTEVWDAAKAADPDLPDHLRVHKPYIDAVTYASPFADGARMRRVPEVIDCWWDAGSMPFAQWGFPHVEGSIDTFKWAFPANFISEALDQTRGWFYGLLAISTLLFGETRDDAKLPAPDLPRPETAFPYNACIVLGLLLGEDRLKMSKRTKNYREPTYIFDQLGADAMRWYFFSAQTPWTGVVFQEKAIQEAQREFLVRLQNVWNFYVLNANGDNDQFDPGSHDGARKGTGWRAPGERSELDRWILGELHRTTRDVRAALDRFENFPAAGHLNDFVDALSNWYLRRSRDRFWRSEKDQDKWDAYNTIHEVLVATAKLIAPFTPFFAESVYQNLVRSAGLGNAGAPESVHLCDYPTADESLIDDRLATEMDLVRQVVSAGRAARTGAKLRVRQPLQRCEVILGRKEHAEWLGRHAELIGAELNIREVELTTAGEEYVTYSIKANFKALGPRFGKKVQAVAKAVAALDAAEARRSLGEAGAVEVEVDGAKESLSGDEVEVRLDAKPGWSAAQARGAVVVVSTELTDELRTEGLLNEVVHHVQGMRKDAALDYNARIKLFVETDDELWTVVDGGRAAIEAECQVDAIERAAAPGGEPKSVKIEGHATKLAIAVV